VDFDAKLVHLITFFLFHKMNVNFIGRRCETNNNNPSFDLTLTKTYAQGYLFVS
jgi:hypothetical protein